MNPDRHGMETNSVGLRKAGGEKNTRKEKRETIAWGKTGEGGWVALLTGEALVLQLPSRAEVLPQVPASRSRLRSCSSSVETAPSSSDKRFPLSAFIKCLSQWCFAAPSPFLEKGRVFLLLLYK